MQRQSSVALCLHAGNQRTTELVLGQNSRPKSRVLGPGRNAFLTIQTGKSKPTDFFSLGISFLIAVDFMISESAMSMVAYMIHMWTTADVTFFSSRIHPDAFLVPSPF